MGKRIDLYKNNELFVSTIQVFDGSQPYETAISHMDYNDGKWIIVQAYDTLKEAKKGHDQWIEKMTSSKLPKELTDCCNSYISQYGKSLGIKQVFKKKKNKN
ncbi:MAG: hypothetical protein SVO01_00680 [Thermotogota bacterium]|nr:hypothetical protein [Thermotogota bacterium]